MSAFRRRSRAACGLPIKSSDLKDENREDRMGEIKERIARGDYRVDAKAVADAILRRMRADRVLRTGARSPRAVRRRRRT